MHLKSRCKSSNQRNIQQLNLTIVWQAVTLLSSYLLLSVRSSEESTIVVLFNSPLHCECLYLILSTIFTSKRNSNSSFQFITTGARAPNCRTNYEYDMSMETCTYPTAFADPERTERPRAKARDDLIIFVLLLPRAQHSCFVLKNNSSFGETREWYFSFPDHGIFRQRTHRHVLNVLCFRPVYNTVTCEQCSIRCHSVVLLWASDHDIFIQRLLVVIDSPERPLLSLSPHPKPNWLLQLSS